MFSTSDEELLLSELIRKYNGRRVLLLSLFIGSDGGGPVWVSQGPPQAAGFQASLEHLASQLTEISEIQEIPFKD